ncbi:DUF1579 domain-containing protein [Pseudoroseomonas cervicalis]|uniref:DUF1579 domain-containing protein n=1 Tax=Teichococcus cervicalis TaxID=204525 RepID=UPI00277FBAC2|nr:DUF1579 domain-containing protein [Pseudoroseomonas cervicalis]MDQ1081068.1 hypothetical protein [Pseudoroseomonas cervicalis]
MQVEQRAEHRWLMRLLGEWDSTGQCTAGPDTSEMRGRESVRALGEVWVLCEGEGEMPGGGQAQMLMTLGYDPAQGCFLGTFTGSMMTHLWTYRGQLQGDTLVLDTEGPDFQGGTARYQDIIRLEGDDTRHMTSRMALPDGSWQEVMRSTFRRRGA